MTDNSAPPGSTGSSAPGGATDDPAPRGSRPGVLFDVDGTLLDTTYQHAVAWGMAFRDAGYVGERGVDIARIHRTIGRSSHELVEDLVGTADERVVEGHTQRYAELRELLEPRVVNGAAELVGALAERGLAVVLATSGKQADLDWMLPALGIEDQLAGITTSDSVDASKPEPDLLAVAAEENDLDLTRTAMVGDATWDAVAAVRLGIPCVALLGGGLGVGELRDAGAAEVWTGCQDLLDNLGDSVLSRLA